MIRFRMLGGVELTSSAGGDIHSVLAQPKRLALLARLAAGSRCGSVRRDTLLGMFWPELDDEHARGALNSAVHHLRRSLGAHAVLSRGDDLQLNGEEIAWDSAAFEQALADGDRAAALDLYRGDLLEGWFVADALEFEQWLANERTRLRSLAGSAAAALARGGAAEHPGEALLWTRRAAALAPDDESLLRLHLELLDRIGDRAGALRAYDDFARRLEAELGGRPAPETHELVEAIRAREAPAAPARGPFLATDEEPETQSPARVTDGGVPPPLLHGPRPPGRTARGRGRARWAAALLALGAGGAVVWRAQPGGAASPRVLVATFENRTGRAELDPIGAMSADWVAAGVARTDLAEVVDPTAAGLRMRRSRPAGGRADDWLAVAASLRAGYLLSGAYYLQGGRIQVHAKLHDVAERRLLVAFDLETVSSDSPMVALAALQERAMGALAERLDPRSRVTWTGTLPPPPPYEAYLAYISGSDEFVRRDHPGALAHFQQAIALDSSFAAAAIKGSQAAWHMRRFGLFDTLFAIAARRPDRLTSFQRVELATMRARLRLDREAWHRGLRELSRRAPESEWTYALALGTLDRGRPREAVWVLESRDPAGPGLDGLFSYWVVMCHALHAAGDYRGELRAARRGLAQYPANLALLGAEVRALAALGRTREARGRMLQVNGRERGPSSWTSGSVLAIAAGELDAHGDASVAAEARALALRWYRSLPPERSEPEVGVWGLTFVLYQIQAWPELESRARGLAVREPGNDLWRAYLGVTAAQRGDRAAAAAADRWLAALTLQERHGSKGLPGFRYEPLFWRARIAGLLGDHDRALHLLREMRGERYDIYDHTDPAFAALRSDPQFQRLMNPPD